MPTYEYECSECGATFEVFQKITARPLTRCKECGAKGTVTRLIGAGAGLIFKGSGFYITDYKKKAATAETGEKKSEAAEKPSEKKEKPEASASKKSSSD